MIHFSNGLKRQPLFLAHPRGQKGMRKRVDVPHPILYVTYHEFKDKLLDFALKQPKSARPSALPRSAPAAA